MSTRFQNSIAVSIAIHLTVIGPALSGINPPELLNRVSKPAGPLVVDYVILREPVKVDPIPKVKELKPVPAAITDAAGIKVEAASASAGGIAVNRAAAIRPRYAKEKKEPAAPRVVNTERSTVKRVDARGDIPVGDIIKKQARVRTTKEFISYFSLIRENIRRELKMNYRNYHGEGDVQLVFVLDSNGRLAGIEAGDSAASKDTKLSDIAVESVRRASPFPHFPKSFSLKQMYFSLIVSFKRQ